MKWIKEIIETLKIFKEYFIPLLLAILLAIISKLFIPNDFFALKKISMNILLFGITIFYFLMIILIIFIFKKIAKTNELKKKLNNEKQKYLRNKISQMKDFIDDLSFDSKNKIKFFLNNNNTSLVYHIHSYSFRNSNDDNLECNLIKTKEVIKNTKYYYDYDTLKKKKFYKGNEVILYRLTDDMYETLKYMKENDIGISHFDDFS